MKRLKQKVRISNSLQENLRIILEPLGEEKFLNKGEETYIFIEFEGENVNISEALEFNISDGILKIFYTNQAYVDWATPIEE